MKLNCRLTKDQLINHWSRNISNSEQLCKLFKLWIKCWDQATFKVSQVLCSCLSMLAHLYYFFIEYEYLLLWNAFHCRKFHCATSELVLLIVKINCQFIETQCALYRNNRRARPNFLPLIQQNTARAAEEAESGGYDTERSLAQPVLDVYGTGPFPRNHSRYCKHIFMSIISFFILLTCL